MKDTPPTPPPKPSIHLNIEDWMPYLVDHDIPESEKVKLIETLWTIVLHFVDLGYDFDVSNIIGGQGFDLTAVLREAVLSSEMHDEEDQ